jgi:hypothetical protein
MKINKEAASPTPVFGNYIGLANSDVFTYQQLSCCGTTLFFVSIQSVQ